MNMWGMRYDLTPEEEADFEAAAEAQAIERYAAAHGLTLTEAARQWAAAKAKAEAELDQDEGSAS